MVNKREEFSSIDALFESTAVGFAILDEELRYVRVNERFAEMNGLPVAAHVGRLIQETVPDVAAVVEPVLRRVLERGQSPMNVEVTVNEAAGGRGQSRVEHYSPLTNEHSDVVGVIVTAVPNFQRPDSTERALRESEQKYRAMFELSTVGQAELDLASGRYLSVNTRFCEITGYDAEELLQMTYAQVTHPDDVNEDHQRFGQLLHGEEEEYTSYKRYVRKDGQIRWVEARARLIRDAEGKPIRSLGSVVDITERVEAEAERERLLAQLAREQDRLEDLNQTLERRVRERTAELVLAEQRERQRIAQVLHDDVQQMLYSIQLTLHVLQGELPPTKGEEMEELERHVAEVVQATRSLSTELQSPGVQRARVEDSFQWLSQFMSNQYGLQVEVDVEGECRIEEPASRELVVRSVRELLFNVVKHAGVQQAQLLAREESDWLVVVVADEGAGFDAGDVLLRTDSRTGLGISTIQERLELLGGQFQVTSRPGAGTRITMRIPV